MEELDKSFSSLVQSEVLLSLTEPSKMNALKALVNKGIPNEHAKRDDQNMETSKQVHFYDGSRDTTFWNICCKVLFPIFQSSELYFWINLLLDESDQILYKDFYAFCADIKRKWKLLYLHYQLLWLPTVVLDKIWTNTHHIWILSVLIFSLFWQEQPDSYDKLVKEMALDMRARPSDRTKTAEEIAQEERERLERLEVSMCGVHGSWGDL